ncbi:ThiF family adenylyltransferase [Bradyrhizobium sp. CSA207]|uniref:HesA/MoeB/ThiF family protein n=1 Tax=Bradyrhizobium sp. CSA207 TaxID=2698826 RepID=UPI0023B0D82C|nr:ThiF family adenylyltransferase [Bradyrhizobium sp. CSA207]MDE5442528.1 ThiF family adenylyltransferase [Bradyrhizobium sp. CSA207]
MSSKGDFTRQSFLGPNSENVLADVRVALVGLGGGGSQIAQQLAHVGVGHYRLLDPQAIEESNLNRLVGATQNDVDRGTAKVEIVQRTILGIRPWATVEAVQEKWQDATYLLRDAHVMFGCVDGFQQREALERAARRFCIPYIDIGMDVIEVAQGNFAISGQMIMTRPGRPCLRCLGFLNSQNLSQEENRYGDAGINPQVVWTNGTLASLAVGAFIRLIAPWSNFKDDFTWLELDGNNQTVTPSPRPAYEPIPGLCPHHGGPDGVGDPFFSL